MGEYHDHPNAAAIAASRDHAIHHIIDILSSAESPSVYAELTLRNAEYIVQDADPFPSVSVLHQLYDEDLRNTPSSIMRVFIRRILRDPVLMKTNLRYCNIRDLPIYAPLWLLVGFEFYAKSFESLMKIRYGEQYESIMLTIAKEFETAFVHHVPDSKAMLDLWLSLILPDRQPPEWYMEVMEKIAVPSPNYVKEALAQLQKQDPGAYEHLVRFYTQFLEGLMVGRHTVLIKKLDRRIKRHAITPIILRDRERFSMMQIYLQDVYTIALYLLAEHRPGPHVFLVGDTHTWFLAAFLEEHFGEKPLRWTASYEDTRAAPFVGSEPHAQCLDSQSSGGGSSWRYADVYMYKPRVLLASTRRAMMPRTKKDV